MEDNQQARRVPRTTTKIPPACGWLYNTTIQPVATMTTSRACTNPASKLKEIRIHFCRSKSRTCRTRSISRNSPYRIELSYRLKTKRVPTTNCCQKLRPPFCWTYTAVVSMRKTSFKMIGRQKQQLQKQWEPQAALYTTAQTHRIK